MNECWRPVVGYERFYEVSDRGRVRSLDRFTSSPFPGGIVRKVPVKGRVLKPVISKSGYHTVVLCNGTGRKTRSYVHRLVLAAFSGAQPPDKPVSRHLNGDPQDNRLENLAYGTYSENSHDSIIHGTHNYAGRTHCTAGHEYITANAIDLGGGRRRCRECMRRYQRAYDQRRGRAV